MTDDFRTVRDFLRHAVSEFRREGLVFGHGASSAVDEAAFMILEALSLPIDDINPWLDARLSKDERRSVAALISKRVETRKPAAYLLGKAYVQGLPFFVDERVIVPRSFIGELLSGPFFAGGEGSIIDDPVAVERVLDLCAGSGCLAVLAAHAFPNAQIDAVDLSADALAVAERNVRDHGLEGRIALHQGDLFAPLSGRRYDLILTNPPYVAEAEMAALPPEYRREPSLALAGGEDGLDIVRRILGEARRHLTPTGGLVCEIGTGRETLESDYPDTEFLWLDTQESAGEVFCLGASALP